MTTRGFKEMEAETLAHLIADVLEAPADEANLERVAGEVKTLCDKFPVYATGAIRRPARQCGRLSIGRMVLTHR